MRTCWRFSTATHLCVTALVVAANEVLMRLRVSNPAGHADDLVTLSDARQAKPVETMLRMYLLHVWFSLSNAGVEDAIYDSYAMRRFSVEQVPDATTLLDFRHLLEKCKLGEVLFTEQNLRIVSRHNLNPPMVAVARGTHVGREVGENRRIQAEV